MLDYDREASHYDETRGGVARADAAAAALDRLFPADAGRILDVGAGTGIVAAALAGTRRTVAGVDGSAGMLGRARDRLPGRRVCGDAARLPFRGAVFDGAYLMWVLHLVPDSDATVAECVRVVAPGGLVVTTVDLHLAHQDAAPDVARVLARYEPDGWAGEETDARERVLAAAEAVGASYAGETTYRGHGRGSSPRAVAAQVRRRGPRWTRLLAPDALAACAGELAALPAAARPRADPTYTVLAVARA